MGPRVRLLTFGASGAVARGRISRFRTAEVHELEASSSGHLGESCRLAAFGGGFRFNADEGIDSVG